jgi:hypothetical protein
MPHLPVSLIKKARISKQKGLHDFTQGYLLNLDKEVEMIFHQSVGIKTEGVSPFVVGKICKECLQIFFVKKYTLLSIPSGDNMIESTREMDSRLSSHSHCLSKKDTNVNA